MVHDANIVFRSNCPNIDLIVYAADRAIYVQVKSSKIPATRDHVTIDGTPWTQKQLDRKEPIFNKRVGYEAEFIVLVDYAKVPQPQFYIFSPKQLTDWVVPRGRKQAAKPKRDGTKRSINFRKELPKRLLKSGHNAWHLFGKPAKQAE